MQNSRTNAKALIITCAMFKYFRMPNKIKLYLIYYRMGIIKKIFGKKFKCLICGLFTKKQYVWQLVVKVILKFGLLTMKGMF